MGTGNAEKVTGSLWRRCSEPHTTENESGPKLLREGDGHPDLCSQVESLLSPCLKILVAHLVKLKERACLLYKILKTMNLVELFSFGICCQEQCKGKQ